MGSRSQLSLVAVAVASVSGVYLWRKWKQSSSKKKLGQKRVPVESDTQTENEREGQPLWVYVNLRDTQDQVVRENILSEFYHSVLVPNFPIANELDDYDDMRLGLTGEDVDPRGPLLTVIVAMVGDDIAGGICFEYYPTSNSGLISYLVTSESYRGMGLASALVHTGIEDINRLSGHKNPLIFAESNAEATSDGVMESKSRHSILQRLGFCLVQCEYVQPPLSAKHSPCCDLILLVHQASIDNGESIPSVAVEAFINDFAASVFGYDYPHEYAHKRWYAVTMSKLQVEESLGVKRSLPWDRSPPRLGSVLVVGAGLAGLTAAAYLGKNGYDVTVVEANDYIGGRIRQLEGFASWDIDIGAEFVHGSSSVLNDIIAEMGWTHRSTFDLTDYESGGQKLIFVNGSVTTMLDRRFPDLEHTYRLWEQMNNDFAGDQLDDVSVYDYFKKHGASQLSLAIAECLYARTAGTSLKRYGAREAARETDVWEEGDDNYRLFGSFRLLVNYLVKKCERSGVRFVLNTSVETINWNHPEVVTKSQDGRTYRSNSVVVTVPITVLKANDISFTPPFPDRKVDALRRIKMESGMKVLLLFPKRFWPRHLGDTGIVFCPTEPFVQVWFDVRGGRTPLSFTSPSKKEEALVTCFLTGEEAEKYRGEEGKKLAVEKSLGQLNRMFGSEDSPNVASDTLLKSHVYNWSDNPFVRGAYSCPSVGACPKDGEFSRTVAGEALGGSRVLFAGEAVSSRCCSTVQAAIETGLKAGVNLVWGKDVADSLDKTMIRIVDDDAKLSL